MNYLIVYGNVIDGIKMIGPFDSAEKANEYGDQLDFEEGFTVAEISLPIGGVLV